MTWNWWLAQGLLCITLALVVWSMQQKNAVRLIWWRLGATASCLIAVTFLGSLPLIFINIAGAIRNIATLYFAYKPDTKRTVKWIASIFIVGLLVSLNIIFWQNYLNVLSIAYGTGLVIAFMQREAKVIRKLCIIVCVLGIIISALSKSPMNVAIETFCLASAIVGIIRHDIKKKNNIYIGDEKK